MISQVNIYVKDIVLMLRDVHVWRSIYNRRSHFFCEKASLRICYIVLFESKGRSLHETDSLIF